MKEKGKVIKIENDGTALLEFAAGSACKKCGACMMTGEGKAVTRAKNGIGAKVGDIVEAEIRPSSVIWSSFLIFIVPVIALIAGYLIGDAQGLGIAGAIIGLILAFIGVGIYDRTLKKKDALACEIVNIEKQ